MNKNLIVSNVILNNSQEGQMGCHTWFYRPITEEEFSLMKDYAPIEISELVNEESIKIGTYDKNFI